jgi:predicted CXXCH cytochrome family protein
VARGERSAKFLAQRINLDYLKGAHPFRQWKFWLSLGVPGVALLWALGITISGRNGIYSAGPLSGAHQVLGRQCEVCHTSTLGFFSQHVKDAACIACHDGPQHQPAQVFTPPCAACHVEHEGTPQLVAVADVKCTQCHANLQTRLGNTSFARSVTSFDAHHPEFAPLRPPARDPGTLRLNHQVHLKAGLKGPKGPVQLVCADCHRQQGVEQPWNFGRPEFRTVPVSETSTHREKAGAYMLPPTFARACVACHTLEFDARFPEQVPHDKPEVVRAFVEKKLREYIALHPAEISRPAGNLRRLPTDKVPPPPRTAAEWVQRELAQAETLLWRKTCAECHTMKPGATSLPEVAPPAMTRVWLPHARFSHSPHRMLRCDSCHAAAKSVETRDVLLPSISLCQQCHHSGEAAENRCSFCHGYHAWGKERGVAGKFSLEEILHRKKTE